MEKAFNIAPCGGVRLSKDSFEIAYDGTSSKPLIDVAGRHKFTYEVSFSLEDGQIISDHTYNEILDKYQSGYKITANYDGLIYTLSRIENGAMFTAIDTQNNANLKMLYLPNGNIAYDRSIDLLHLEPEKYIVESYKRDGKTFIKNNLDEEFELPNKGKYVTKLSGKDKKLIVEYNDGTTKEIDVGGRQTPVASISVELDSNLGGNYSVDLAKSLASSMSGNMFVTPKLTGTWGGGQKGIRCGLDNAVYWVPTFPSLNGEKVGFSWTGVMMDYEYNSLAFVTLNVSCTPNAKYSWAYDIKGKAAGFTHAPTITTI